MTGTEPQSAPRAGAPGRRGHGDQGRDEGRSRALLWLPGLLVAIGAAVATAHGLYEVAVASRVPELIAWLYPLITDGLALVAYIATARLPGRAARYAWSVVVVAAGLSGLAQAAYLAGGPAVEVAPALRFGVGAWPAVAAAVAAHLLHLLATTTEPGPAAARVTDGASNVHSASAAGPAFSVQPDRHPESSAGSSSGPFTAPALGASVQPDPEPARVHPHPPGRRPEPTRAMPSPARDRAEVTAERHARHHGAWPTVSELEAAAEVSRGTAAAALKALRNRPTPLHLITTNRPAADPDDHNPEPEANS